MTLIDAKIKEIFDEVDYLKADKESNYNLLKILLEQLVLQAKLEVIKELK